MNELVAKIKELSNAFFMDVWMLNCKQKKVIKLQVHVHAKLL